MDVSLSVNDTPSLRYVGGEPEGMRQKRLHFVVSHKISTLFTNFTKKNPESGLLTTIMNMNV